MTTQLEPGNPAYRRFVVGLFLAGFATFIQVFSPQALLPEVVAAEGVTPAEASLLISGMAAGIAVSVLPWASIADRVGHIRAMKISVVASSVIALVSPLLPLFGMTVGARVLGGVLLGAVPGVAMAYIAVNITSRWAGLVAGTFVAGNTLGGVAGRLVAGSLAEFIGWRPALVVIGIVAALAAAAFVVIAPPQPDVPPRDSQHVLARIALNLRDPYMLGLYSQGFLLMGAFVIVYNYLGFRLQQPPILLSPLLGSFVFVIYLFGTVASRQAGNIVRRIGRLPTILSGIAVMLVSLPLMLTPWLATSLIGLAVFTLGCFTAHPTASSLSGQAALGGRNQATAMYQIAFLGGTSLFGWVGGILYTSAGWTATLLLVGAMCLTAALLGVLGLWTLRNHRPHVHQ